MTQNLEKSKLVINILLRIIQENQELNIEKESVETAEKYEEFEHEMSMNYEVENDEGVVENSENQDHTDEILSKEINVAELKCDV